MTQASYTPGQLSQGAPGATRTTPHPSAPSWRLTECSPPPWAGQRPSSCRCSTPRCFDCDVGVVGHGSHRQSAWTRASAIANTPVYVRAGLGCHMTVRWEIWIHIIDCHVSHSILSIVISVQGWSLDTYGCLGGLIIGQLCQLVLFP